jgi:hypothetical protein
VFEVKVSLIARGERVIAAISVVILSNLAATRIFLDEIVIVLPGIDIPLGEVKIGGDEIESRRWGIENIAARFAIGHVFITRNHRPTYVKRRVIGIGCALH